MYGVSKTEIHSHYVLFRKKGGKKERISMFIEFSPFSYVFLSVFSHVVSFDGLCKDNKREPQVEFRCHNKITIFTHVAISHHPSNLNIGKDI